MRKFALLARSKPRSVKITGDPRSEQALVDVGLEGGTQAASSDSFRALFERNVQDVSRYVQRRATSGRDDAADVVAETFAIAWRKRGDVPAPPEDRFWLLGVARRQLAAHSRGEVRRARLRARLRSERPLPSSDGTPAALEGLELALGQLPEVDHEIFRLYCWERLSQAEIASVLGMSRKAVERRMARAREHMRSVAEPERDRSSERGAPEPRLAAGEGAT